jgi:hypothetical protein
MLSQEICCTNNTQCAANNGSPTKCTEACASAFFPFFSECGALFLVGEKTTGQPSSLGRFYHTCTASNRDADKKLCTANAANAREC